MSNFDTIRTALIGFGLAGQAFHAPLIAAEPRLRLAAIVTSNAERQALARERYPAARIMARADEVFAAAGEFDLVVVATANRTHLPLAHAALEAGLAVVVDKPLAGRARDAADLVAAAERKGALLTVFHNRRWDNDFLTLRRLLDEGALGAVHRFESRFERWRPDVGAGWRESAEAEDVGGVLYDLGSHLVDQALVLFGPAALVYAERSARRPGALVDDDVFIALTHASGVRSHLWMSLCCAAQGPRLRVLGGEAAYVKYGLDPQERALRDGEAPSADWGDEDEAFWGELQAGDERRRVPSARGDYPAFYAGVARALIDGAAPPVDARDAVAGLAVIEAAARSAAGGVAVRVEELAQRE
jgi:predicted dehydrogenase